MRQQHRDPLSGSGAIPSTCGGISSSPGRLGSPRLGLAVSRL